MNRMLKMGHMLIVFVLFMASGCSTIGMFQDYEYTEEISSVLISQDKKKIVAITNQYHYMFDAPQGLIKILESPIHNKVSATFNSFKVTKDNEMSGSIVLSSNGEVSDVEIAMAKELGFYMYGAQSYKWYTWQNSIKGVRYSASDFTLPNSSYKLNKPYVVRIEAERTTTEKLLRVPLTPITLAFDGTVTLGALVFLPLWLPSSLHRHH